MYEQPQVPEAEFDALMAYVTAEVKCKDTTCFYASVEDFPDLEVLIGCSPLRCQEIS